MINRKSRDEIKRMKHAGHIVALVHKAMKENINDTTRIVVAQRIATAKNADKIIFTVGKIKHFLRVK